MEQLLVVLSFLGMGVALASFRLPLWLSVILLGLALLPVHLLTAIDTRLVWPLWLALALVCIGPVRRRMISAPALSAFKRAMPAMSSTERDALDAGTVWWDGELFGGRPRWQMLLDTPKPQLSDAEQAFLDGPVERLCGMLDDWKINQERRDLPPQVWEFIKKERFFGMIIPTQSGGLGFSAQAHSKVVAKVATRSITAATTIIVPNSLGPAELLLRYGTATQKRHYLPRLASGEDIPCFALTNPNAGSDAASIPDRGIVCQGEFEGRQVLGFRLTWEKRYITLAPVATLLGLAFRAYDPDKLLGEVEDLGITLALIPTRHPGVVIGRRHLPAGQSFMNGPTSGEDVFIPLDWVIGGQRQVGNGWKMLMNCLAAGRAISLPALSTAAATMAARMTGAYARIRKQFKVPIAALEGVEEVLARIAGEAYSLEAARRLTTVALDAGHEPAVVSAVVKYRSTEGLRRTLNDAMDVHGGRGICAGPSNYLLSGYQSIPVGITVEGANILTRSMIVFGQGAVRCHPWLLKELEATRMENSAEAIAAFDAALRGHLGHLLGNIGRTLWHNLSFGQLISVPVTGPTRRWYRQVTLLSINFALLSDIALLTMGGQLKRREKISGRFADVLAEMYIMSASLKRFEDEGRPREDLPLLHFVCLNGLHVAQQKMAAILQNFPVRWLRWPLRRLFLPWGCYRRPAGDKLGRAAAFNLTRPGEARERLTEGVYVGGGRHDDPAGRVEHAFELVIQAAPLERRLRKALRLGQLDAGDDATVAEGAVEAGILKEEEATLLKAAANAVRIAIDVDDFPYRQGTRVTEAGATDGNAAAA